MWFQKAAASNLIGQPLTTSFPYDLISSLEVTKLPGYDVCGSNITKWQEHAGDPNYNLLNECCQAILADTHNHTPLGYSDISQRTMDYLIDAGTKRNLPHFSTTFLIFVMTFDLHDGRSWSRGICQVLATHGRGCARPPVRVCCGAHE